jgi:hypothetical protein
MAEALRPEDYRKREESAGQWKLNVVSYKLGDKYLCSVDNVSPGATLARAEGKTREEAEAKALNKARKMVKKTRTFS